MSDVRKVAGYVRVSPEMLADAAPMRDALDEAFDRHFNPWRYPDRNRWPAFQLFGGLVGRVLDRLDRQAEP